MTTTARSVLVVTVVHRPEDARIRHRQIGALLAAGWVVTYAAPFAAHGQPPPPGVVPIELPRASDRRRWRALRAARRLLRTVAHDHDVVLLHDPELLLALPGSGVRHAVWDVHEDPAAALRDRDWVPAVLRGPLAAGVSRLERWGERRCAELLLAERGYAERFARPHPIVLNLPLVPAQVPPPGSDRVVYVGRLSRGRGAAELVALGEQLAGEVVVDVVGYADADVEPLLDLAHERGHIRWHGFVPNDEALRIVEGAAYGLSLLHDQANYRVSMPTKVVEYLAHGVPVVTTPLPEAVALVEGNDVGAVVPFGSVDEVARVVRAGTADRDAHREQGARAHRLARDQLDWRVAGPSFVAVLADVADRTRAGD